MALSKVSSQLFDFPYIRRQSGTLAISLSLERWYSHWCRERILVHVVTVCVRQTCLCICNVLSALAWAFWYLRDGFGAWHSLLFSVIACRLQLPVIIGVGLFVCALLWWLPCCRTSLLGHTRSWTASHYTETMQVEKAVRGKHENEIKSLCAAYWTYRTACSVFLVCIIWCVQYAKQGN